MLARCRDGAAGPLPSRPRLLLGEVLRAGLPAYAQTHRLPTHHWKILNAIQVCRTPRLGGHLYECSHCHREHFAPHACGNRHCPTCQGSHSRRWLAEEEALLLPIPYFHLVFTLPHQLNPLLQQNQRQLYNLLFGSASQTLLGFGRQNLGAQLGITAVLHTWSQTLLDHYHLHCIVTGGGLALKGSGWVGSRSDYLFNVSALSTVFRAKFCEGLQELYAQKRLEFHGQLEPLAAEANFQALIRQATRTGWVVYSKRPFAGPEQVLRYLARYTHRVGLSNQRLLRLDRAAATITFAYKDYADGARHKTMQLSLAEFIRRLRLHFLPAHFVKLRHYGLLANRGRQERLARVRAAFVNTEPPDSEWARATKTPPPSASAALPVCPFCGQPALVLVRIVDPVRRRPAPVISPAVTDTS